MADQQRKVSLIFEANASQAKSEINDLVASLQKIQATPATLIDSKGIKEASKAALELQSHLQKAVNTDTGKLDLNRFANSLSASGKSLEQYRNTLTKIGPAGNAAFKSLLTSINNAEASTVRLTRGMRDFITTMKNTVKWQISSSMMHGMMSAIQSANSYAQQLDRSLNDIRIVSGASAEEMARFAVEANRAAQALSTTTTKYTDAALIFYQQGLNDQQVKERTEAVIKMANVTGEAAKDVSSYMTAIWNNFADGSKSLEYYADVITKLGAATAASSEEIAGGLEKFAAIGNTIGLSYEYATSMITTIVDKTRQSEDVVGTALKTILARIQGLNLGETLEDGTTLNKYSGALEKVGINIKDASGQLKDMDVILDELGSKWGTFSKDTQVALAQVVGGVRQYNQIISLMNNWDSFQKNVQIAETSAGSLNEQADVYAESWEAARNRVRTAAQGIYDALLDEKVFIQLDDIFTNLLNGITGVVKGMGGMVPLIGTIGGFITQKFAKEMPVALNNMAQNLAILTGKAQNKAADWQAQTTRQAELGRDASVGDAKGEAEYETIRRISVMREQLLRNQHQMNSEEIEHYESLIRNEEAIGKIVESRAEALGILERETQQLKEQVALRTAEAELERASDFTNDDTNSKKWEEAERQAREEMEEKLRADLVRQHEIKKKPTSQRSFEEKRELDEIAQRSKQYYYNPRERKGHTNDYYQAIDTKAQAIFIKQAKEQATAIIDTSSALKQVQLAAKDFSNFTEDMKLDEGSNKVKDFKEKLEALKTTMGSAGADTSQIDEIITQLGDASEVEKPQIEAVTKAINDMVAAKERALQQAQTDGKEYNISDEDIAALTEQGAKEGAKASGALDRGEIPEIPKSQVSTIEALTSATGTLMSTYSAIIAVQSAWNTVMDENATGMERAGAVIGGLSSATMALNSILQLSKVLKLADVAATYAKAKADILATGTSYGLAVGIKAIGVAIKSVPIIGWIIAIVSALIGLIAIISSIKIKSDTEKQIEKLTKQSEALSDAQAKLVEHINEVQSAWDNYENMTSALEECTVGTQEWSEALSDCNQAVLQILSLAPHMAEFVQYNPDGSISLAGEAYENYMADLARTNSAMGAAKLVTDNEIKQLEISKEVPLNHQAFSELNKRWTSEYSSLFNEDGTFLNIDTYLKAIEDVFEAFGEDIDGALNFLQQSGLATDSYDAKVLYDFYNEDTLLGPNGYDSTEGLWELYGYNAVTPIESLSDWGEKLNTWDSYEKSSQAAYATFFGNLEDYNYENLNVYTRYFEDAIDAALSDSNNKYVATDDEDELRNMMVATFKGELEDYKDMDIDSMRYALALADVSTDLDVMDGIISQVNTTIKGLNDVGQSLIRTGNLTAASLSNLGQQALISPINWTAEDISGLSDVKSYTPENLYTMEDAHDSIHSFKMGLNEQFADAEWASELAGILPNLNNRIITQTAYETDLDTRYAEADKVLKTAEGILDLAYGYDMHAANDVTMASNPQSAAQRQDWAHYDYLRAILPTEPTTIPGWKFWDKTSDYEDTAADIAALEEKYGADFLQSRPLLDVDQALLNKEIGQAENWYVDENTASQYIPQGPLVIDTINAGLEEVGLSIRATAENLAIEGEESFENLYSKELAPYRAVQEEYDNYYSRDNYLATSKGLVGTKNTYIDLLHGTYTEEDLLDPNFDPYAPIKEYLSEFFVDEDVTAIIDDYLSNNGDVDWSQYIPKDQYQNWVTDIQETLGEDFINLFPTEEEFEAFQLLDAKDQYEYLNTTEKAYEIDRLLNKANEDVLRRIFQIEEGVELFEGLIAQGVLDADQVTYTNYGQDYNLAYQAALEKDPETLYHHAMLSTVGITDEDKYAITSKGAAKFAKNFGLLSAEEIADGVDWQEIAERFNELVIENMELGIEAWNAKAPERFKTNLTVNQETGQYELPEGIDASEIDEFFQYLVSVGASVQDISGFMSDISAIAPGLTTGEFSKISTIMKDMIQNGAELSDVMEVVNAILEQTRTKGAPLTDEEISAIMEDAGLSIDLYGTEIEELTGIIYHAVDSITALSDSFKELEGTLGKLQQLIGLTTGTEISEEDFEAISNYIPEEYKHLFMRSVGGYTFYGTEDQGKTIEAQARTGAWEEHTQRRDTIQTAGTEAGLNGILQVDEFSLENQDATGQVLDWVLSNNLLNDPNFAEFINGTGMVGEGNYEAFTQAGFSADDFDPDTGKYIGSGDAEAGATGQLIAEAILSYLRGDYEGLDSEGAQMKMTGMRTTSELDQAVANGDLVIGTEKGQITQEQYDAYYNNLADQEFKIEMEELNLDTDEIEGLSKTLQELAKDFDENNKGANELSEELIDNEKAAKEVAKEIKRYDRALESVRDNQKEWTEALKSGNPDDMAKAIGEMDKAYSDMLDIDPGSLSEGFLQNAKNLELMKEAAEGSEKAYAELQARAEDDLLIQAGIDPNSDIWGEINSLQDTIHSGIDDIEVGASIDNTQAIQAMNELINMAGMTAEEATNYLASMGVDAEVEQIEVPEDQTYAGATATVQNIPISWSMPLEAGGSGSGSIPSITYAPQEIPVEGTKTATALRVTSAKKSSGGGFKHSNSSAGSGRGSRRGGGGGRRGGGGGRRAPQAPQKKDSEKERYHTITNVLEDLVDALDKVSKASDRAFGKARVKLLQEQQRELKKLAAAQQDYLDEINQNLQQDQSNLAQVSSYVGFDVQLDENGTITNFAAIQDAMWAEYNSHINEQGEVIGMDEEAWEAYTEEWERIMALIEQYEETQDLRKEALQQLQDYINQIYDLELEEITYTVEINIEASEFTLEFLEYMLKKVEDDAWSAAEAIANMGLQAQEFLEESDEYKEGIEGILNNHTEDITDSDGNVLQAAQLTPEDVAAFMAGDPEAIAKVTALGEQGAFTAEEVESLKEYYSNLLRVNESLLELRESVYETVTNAFLQFNEEMDKMIEKLDHLANVTQHYRNIVDIVGKENLGVSNALLESVGQAGVEQSINRVEATRIKKETIEAEIARAEEALANARANGLEEDAQYWEETLETMNASLAEAEEEFLTSWEDALTAANEQFELAVTNAIETLSDALAGPLAGSLEELQANFDRQSEVAERYLPDYEKIYELSKLNRDITNSIDETSNIKAKQELAALQAEINALEEEGVQVSEYQMENLRRRYELKLAEIALSEAQNAKSQVQMSRDADGNWSYVYTADENQVAEAEQSYEDKLFAIQQANGEYIQAMQENMIQLELEYKQEVEAIMLDETLSAEERMQRLNEVTEYYKGKMEYYGGELNLVLGENKRLYDEDWAAYSDATGYKMSLDEEYVDSFDETALAIGTGFDTMEAFQQNFNEAIGDPETGGLLYDLNNAYVNWEANVEAAMNAAGTSVEGFATEMGTQVSNALTESEELTDGMEELSDDIVSEFDEMVDAAEDWANTWSSIIDQTIAENEALVESFQAILDAWSAATPDEEPEEEEQPQEEEPSAPAEEEEEEEEDDGAIGQITIKKGYQYWGYKSPKGGDKNKVKVVNDDRQERTYRFTQMDTSTSRKRVYIPSEGVWVSSYDPDGPKRIKVEKFDTGGYTGSWGTEGKMAMLHEKEIVLNRDDTSNLLSAVGMIRQIAEIIDLNAYSSAGFGSNLINSMNTAQAGTLEQVVHITAEFPNAVDKNEIYAAFGEIVNLASQYANRK